HAEGGGVPSPCRTTGGAAVGVYRSDYSSHHGSRVAQHPAGYARAHPAGTRTATHLGRTTPNPQRTCRARGGHNVQPGPRVMHAGGGNGSPLPRAVRPVAVLLHTPRFAKSA